MPALIDLTNQRFDRLLVIERTLNHKNNTMWFCQCDCGKTHITRGTFLRNNSVRSCGCINSELRKQRGKYAHNWKGGKIINRGYILQLIPKTSGKSQYRMEHILIMEKI